MSADSTIAVVGLGYVGLPLAVAFGTRTQTIGFDLDEAKVQTLRSGKDPNRELSDSEVEAAKNLEYTSDPTKLKNADVVIVAVPTPIDHARRPDLSMLKSACTLIGQNLKTNALVVVESTVYPGLTEEYCVPILELQSGFICGKDFDVGYSPERINPGDREHTLSRITKVVAAQSPKALDRVAAVYERVVEVGVFRASSIKVAEAAKVIENTQRDLNIALMNELSILFDRMDIDTEEVLQAAGTKWNFLPFRPGLVGGHCIGVDPYYLTYKAETLGYNPQVILAGRRINDNMGKWVAEKTVKHMISAGQKVKDAHILVMGLSFKENCPDIRNTRVIDVIDELKSFGARVSVWDPVVDPKQVQETYGFPLSELKDLSQLNAIIAAVPHTEIRQTPLTQLREISTPEAPFIDVKSAFSREKLSELGFPVWRL